MAGQVQMIYFDPPYGIKYGSNFQPFVDKRDVKDRRDEDLTQEPETIKAFRDTWELGIHSYLTYLRDRLLLAKELLSESGSVFVQISDENLHHVREMMDEIFGKESFIAQINFKLMMPLESGRIESVFDYVVWYAKDKTQVKYRNLYLQKDSGGESEFIFCDDVNGFRKLSNDERKEKNKESGNLKIFKRSNLASFGYTPSCTFEINFSGELFPPANGKSWRTTYEGIERLHKANRLFKVGKKLYFKLYLGDFGLNSMTNSWADTIAFDTKFYVVQTTPTVIERCMLMSTDPGDLVLDPTCGSGTTAFVAEKWGRRWITCDTSRVAVTLAKQRLMTASYDYYELRYPQEGLRGGFIYKTVPHVMLKSIANNPEIDAIYERMHPAVDPALADLNKAMDKNLKEWEMPFDFPDDWAVSARKPFDAFHAARQSMQKQMDASIAAH